MNATYQISLLEGLFRICNGDSFYISLWFLRSDSSSRLLGVAVVVSEPTPACKDSSSKVTFCLWSSGGQELLKTGEKSGSVLPS